jgi:hypothetical protein
MFSPDTLPNRHRTFLYSYLSILLEHDGEHAWLYAEVYKKKLVGCDLLGVSDELDSSVRQILIQGVVPVGIFGKICKVIVVNQLRV